MKQNEVTQPILNSPAATFIVRELSSIYIFTEQTKQNFNRNYLLNIKGSKRIPFSLSNYRYELHRNMKFIQFVHKNITVHHILKTHKGFLKQIHSQKFLLKLNLTTEHFSCI